MKIVWKVSRRSRIAHAYELPFLFRRGLTLPSICNKLQMTLLSEISDEGSRCSVCEREILKAATSGGLDL